MTSYVEHANVTVSNLDKAIEFLTIGVPEFDIRKRFVLEGREWAHVGTPTSYIAVVEETKAEKRPAEMDGLGFNHVGFVVPDVTATRDRLRDAGFEGGYNDGELIEASTRTSVYYLDGDGNEYEFMQYLTPDIEARNIYDV
jgi:catechol 2,3-dioxygenase-like lactoylglutathione lyase family enzyme